MDTCLHSNRAGVCSLSLNKRYNLETELCLKPETHFCACEKDPYAEERCTKFIYFNTDDLPEDWDSD